jgi:hypothetical protein
MGDGKNKIHVSNGRSERSCCLFGEHVTRLTYSALEEEEEEEEARV